MALTYAATNVVNCGSAASLDNLTTGTRILWAYPTTVNGRLVEKASNSRLDANTGGSIEILIARATTPLNYISTGSTMVANVWQCVAATWDLGSNVGHLYIGTLTSPMAEVTYAISQGGSGAITSDAASNLLIGNRASGAFTHQGAIADVAVFNRALTIGELRDWQFNPRKMTGCVGFWRLGSNGTTDVPDLSGNFNTGSITGTTVSAHVPVRSFRMGRSSIRSPGGYTAPAYTPTDYGIPRGVTRGVIGGAIV